MSIFTKLERILNSVFYCCPFICNTVCSKYYKKQCLKFFIPFLIGFGVGQLYFQLFIKEIQLLFCDSLLVGLFISLFLGLINIMSVQMRCISVLLLPMYCGKAGRGVLKAVVLSYVVAGPITNLGLNAKEVVRVYACSTELLYNLTKIRYEQTYQPLNKALLSFNDEIFQIKETLRSIREVISPIEYEIEGTAYVDQMKAENYLADVLLDIVHKVNLPVIKNQTGKKIPCQNKYANKMKIRCENLISHAISTCFNIFYSAYVSCIREVSHFMICRPLMIPQVCDVKRLLGPDICNFTMKIEPNISKEFKFLKKVKQIFTMDLEKINLRHNITHEHFSDAQNAKEAGQRVMQAFDEKYLIMKAVFVAVNLCLALLVLRIAVASVTYHDMYLTNIDYDNVYITGYFKNIDRRRLRRNEFTLLPSKKMERTKYIDIHSLTYIPSERSKLVTQILKVMLEAITATTFVMLDRLFYEALDVVRQFALEPLSQYEGQDIEIKVKGNGELSTMMRKVLTELASTKRNVTMSNDMCLPRPRAMPTSYYFKIYGGYLWILVLLYVNPYTLRLRRVGRGKIVLCYATFPIFTELWRHCVLAELNAVVCLNTRLKLICSYFYPIREKQRILHLYNDILKKRMKIEKTLRRKAVQAVRAHYLSGENLLSLRMRYPQVLGWLGTLSAARMKCLICEEPEPGKLNCNQHKTVQIWHSCISTRCPFVYCNECWQDVGNQCLACDPALAELSDIDSLSDDSPPRY